MHCLVVPLHPLTPHSPPPHSPSPITPITYHPCLSCIPPSPPTPPSPSFPPFLPPPPIPPPPAFPHSRPRSSSQGALSPAPDDPSPYAVASAARLPSREKTPPAVAPKPTGNTQYARVKKGSITKVTTSPPSSPPPPPPGEWCPPQMEPLSTLTGVGAEWTTSSVINDASLTLLHLLLPPPFSRPPSSTSSYFLPLLPSPFPLPSFLHLLPTPPSSLSSRPPPILTLPSPFLPLQPNPSCPLPLQNRQHSFHLQLWTRESSRWLRAAKWNLKWNLTFPD